MPFELTRGAGAARAGVTGSGSPRREICCGAPVTRGRVRGRPDRVNALVRTAIGDGALWWGLIAAPALCLLLMAPFSPARAEDVEDAVTAPATPAVPQT